MPSTGIARRRVTADILAIVVVSIIASGCGTLGGPTRTLNRKGPVAAGEDTTLLKHFANSYTTAKSTGAGAPAFRKFLGAGAMLVEASCHDFLNELGKVQQEYELGRGQAGILSGVTSAVLGVTGANQKALALVGTAFGGVLAGGEVFQDTVLFSPDTKAVSDLVLRALSQQAKEVKDQAAQLGERYTFENAVGDVMSVQKICEVANIRGLVNQAVSQGKLETVSTSARDDLAEKIRSAKNDSARSRLAEAVGVPSLSPDQIVAFWWAYMEGPELKEEGWICGQLSNLALDLVRKKKPCTADGKIDLAYPESARILGALQGLSEDVRTGLTERVNALKATLKDATDRVRKAAEEQAVKDEEDIAAAGTKAVETFDAGSYSLGDVGGLDSHQTFEVRVEQ